MTAAPPCSATVRSKVPIRLVQLHYHAVRLLWCASGMGIAKERRVVARPELHMTGTRTARATRCAATTRCTLPPNMCAGLESARSRSASAAPEADSAADACARAAWSFCFVASSAFDLLDCPATASGPSPPSATAAATLAATLAAKVYRAAAASPSRAALAPLARRPTRRQRLAWHVDRRIGRRVPPKPPAGRPRIVAATLLLALLLLALLRRH